MQKGEKSENIYIYSNLYKFLLFKSIDWSYIWPILTPKENIENILAQPRVFNKDSKNKLEYPE